MNSGFTKGYLLRGKHHLWLAACLVAGFILLPLSTFAHNGGFPRLNGVETGGYRLYAWTLPNPWYAGEELHVSVAVTQADVASDVATGPSPEVLVADAVVSASFTPPTGSRAVAFSLPLSATESLGGIYYESNLQLAEDGDWQVSILSNGAKGESSADFVVTVLPNRQTNWLLIGGGGALFVALLGVAAIMGRRKPAATTGRRH